MSTVSPGTTASCARGTVANGFSNVPGSPSLPVGETKNSAAKMCAPAVGASNQKSASLIIVFLPGLFVSGLCRRVEDDRSLGRNDNQRGHSFPEIIDAAEEAGRMKRER